LIVRAKIRFLRTSLALGLILLGTSGQEALATIGSATYTFDVSNGGGGAPTSGNFGSATINVTSLTTATISFTASPTYSFVGFGFNFNGTVTQPTETGSISNITGIPSGWSLQQNGQMDGFGTFTYDYEGNGASTAVTSGTFNITGQNLELSQFQVLSKSPAPNGNVVVGAHLLGSNLTGGQTFFAGGHQTSGPPTVPEPSTLALAALGGLGFLGYGLRRRLKK
jgi:hypothetical protein